MRTGQLTIWSLQSESGNHICLTDCFNLKTFQLFSFLSHTQQLFKYCSRLFILYICWHFLSRVCNACNVLWQIKKVIPFGLLTFISRDNGISSSWVWLLELSLSYKVWLSLNWVWVPLLPVCYQRRRKRTEIQWKMGTISTCTYSYHFGILPPVSLWKACEKDSKSRTCSHYILTYVYGAGLLQWRVHRLSSRLKLRKMNNADHL